MIESLLFSSLQALWQPGGRRSSMLQRKWEVGGSEGWKTDWEGPVMVKTDSKEEVQPVPPRKNSVRMHGVPGSREERLKGGHQEGQAPSLAAEEPFGWGGACCQSTLLKTMFLLIWLFHRWSILHSRDHRYCETSLPELLGPYSPCGGTLAKQHRVYVSRVHRRGSSVWYTKTLSSSRCKPGAGSNGFC